MKNYKVLLAKETVDRAQAYLNKLKVDNDMGKYLYKKLRNVNIAEITIEQFIELLVQTKTPTIFAESSIIGNGADWNPCELSLLGDINIAVPVTVYDNGKHFAPQLHKTPFSATLLFTPGALLRNDKGKSLPADWQQVTKDNQLDPQKYYQLYEKRLLPLFLYANDIAKSKNKMALITIPGLGCGQFAGRFKGQLGAHLQNTLEKLLKKYGEKLTNIKAVYYDPYQECSNQRFEIGKISLLVRPLTMGNENKPQLCLPQAYQEQHDDFSDCELFSVVAWDHVSWPGNDFYLGSRSTDDGVKAAATNSMAAMTGITGKYEAKTNTYNPPLDYYDWQCAIVQNKIELEVQNNLMIYSWTSRKV